MTVARPYRLTWSAFVVVRSSELDTGELGAVLASNWWKASANSSTEFKALVTRELEARYGQDLLVTFGPVSGSSRGPWEL